MSLQTPCAARGTPGYAPVPTAGSMRQAGTAAGGAAGTVPVTAAGCTELNT
jgi:hypothetical protein